MVSKKHGYPTMRGDGRKPFRDLTGVRVGRLVVVRYLRAVPTGHRGINRHRWECACDCGQICERSSDGIMNGSARSCGCLKSEMLSERQKGKPVIFSHGLSYTNEYRILEKIIRRCTNASDPGYPLYGGRGIVVCERWRQSVENFVADMGLRPSKNHSVDRINNDGNYEPGNCRWATRSEQQRNTRSNVRVTINGVTKCVAEWADEFGACRQVAYVRIKRGWDHQRAVTTPTGPCQCKSCVNGAHNKLAGNSKSSTEVPVIHETE